MSYSFQPMSEEELNSINLVDDGIYDFEVIKSTRKTSKSGNPMAELNIKFWDKGGQTHTLFDYLVFSKVNLNIRKVKHFCDTTGLSKEYSLGELPEELKGLCGKFSLKTQGQQPDGRGGFYPAKNVVEDYIKSDIITDASQAGNDENFLNDPIPF